MRIKRIPAVLLCAALACLLCLGSAAAADSSFDDISHPQTAVNADVLRLMGVVSGTGDNRFTPDRPLTRAEFCTMAVKFMGKEDQVSHHTSRTIFSDVTSRHWGLGYINLAASLTVKDGDLTLPLISGVGNGRFEPDSHITYGQAVTILVRVLGYSGQQAAGVWPDSFMALGSSIGLTDQVNAGPHDTITRAQAAQLFVNALSCKTAQGEPYYKSLGQPMEDVIILSARDGQLRTSRSAVPFTGAVPGVTPTALEGQWGTLVTDERDDVACFVPNHSTGTTIVLASDARSGYVTSVDGRQIPIPSTAQVYSTTSLEGENYSSASAKLRAGDQITLYSRQGKVVAVYAAGTAAGVSLDAVVVRGTPSTAMFQQLTDGVTGYSVVKDGQTIRLSDLRDYDVVTYDSLNNTLVASDTRLSCLYENALPNVRVPESVTALGHTFPVLESAWDTLDDVALGDRVVLLLTHDGRVAGIVPASTSLPSTAIGVVTATGADMLLPNGQTVSLTGEVSDKSRLLGQLTILTCMDKGELYAASLPNLRVTGPFDVSAMTLGKYTVCADVALYEQINGAPPVAISLEDLSMQSIRADQIKTYHLNTSDMVELIVLSNVTGNAYEYGTMAATSRKVPASYDAQGNLIRPESSRNVWSLVRGSEPVIPFAPQVLYSGSRGAFVGIAPTTLSDGTHMIDSLVQLTRVATVSGDDFFQRQGKWYVTAGGRSYLIAETVECFRDIDDNLFSPDNWFTQETATGRLEACMAYSDKLTIYIDPVGQVVRVVEAER